MVAQVMNCGILSDKFCVCNGTKQGCVLTLQGLAPRYLGPLTGVADLPGRRSLRSANLNRLDVPFVRLSTVGGRAFNVAGPRIWNSLPDHVTMAGTLTTFRHRLKTFLFQQSYSQ